MSSEKAPGPKGPGRKGPKPKGSKPKGSGRRSDRETSAGGVVIRGEPGREQLAAIVPVRRSPSGARVLCLPKGHIDPGEDALQAAVREVREETGIHVELIADLGEIDYWYRRDGRTVAKSVAFFLFRYLRGDLADHDDEVEQARWIDLRGALSELSYGGERKTVARALRQLGTPAGARDSDDRSGIAGEIDGAADGRPGDGRPARGPRNGARRAGRKDR